MITWRLFDFLFVFFHILCFNCRYPYKSKSEPIKVFHLYPNALAPLIQGLMASGFTLLPANPPVPRLFLPCPVGTFSNSYNQGTEGCTPCPAGIRLVIYMLFTGWENNKKVIRLPRSVCIGRNCARGLESSDWDIFSNWDSKVSGKFSFTLQSMCVEVGCVRVDQARDRLQTKTKPYNMIFSPVIYILILIALF